MTWPTDYLNKVICGDCLEAMRGIPDNSVDLVLTDPPYSSGARQGNQLRARGAMLRGERWESEWFGTDNLSSNAFSFFMRGILLIAFQKAKPGAHGYFFIDWRNYPLLSGIAESAGWRINNLLVWDKKIFGMGNGYRNQHELIILCSKGSPRNYGQHDNPNVLQSKRVLQEFHPTEKPVDLLTTFIEMSTDQQDLILDPFFGSGTTGVAAKLLGRQFIGIEISEKYCEIARKRIDGTLVNRKLQFEARP